MKKLLLFAGIALSAYGSAQVKTVPPNNLHRIPVKLPATVTNGDTLAVVDLCQLMVYGYKVFPTVAEATKYYVLVENVKAAYPYAVMIEATFNQCEQTLNTIPDKREKKKYLKQVEEQLKTQYEDDLKNLTIDQGRLLIKLINRQTGTTSYEMVKELKGSFSAFMWQTVATVFGNNMKDTYDPTGEDKDIEDIINLIEQGAI